MATSWERPGGNRRESRVVREGTQGEEQEDYNWWKALANSSELMVQCRRAEERGKEGWIKKGGEKEGDRSSTLEALMRSTTDVFTTLQASSNTNLCSSSENSSRSCSLAMHERADEVACVEGSSSLSL